MHGGSEQKPSTNANTWYGVQQATNAPKINEIVRNALRARFSDFDFGRPPTNGIFLRPFNRFPIDRMKSRLLAAFSLTVVVAACCEVLDAAGVIEVRFGFLPVKSMVVVVDAAIVVGAALDVCANMVVFEHMLLSVLEIKRSSAICRSAVSSRLDFCVFIALTIVVTGRSAFSLTFTVILYLLKVSVVDTVIDE